MHDPGDPSTWSRLSLEQTVERMTENAEQARQLIDDALTRMLKSPVFDVEVFDMLHQAKGALP